MSELKKTESQLIELAKEVTYGNTKTKVTLKDDNFVLGKFTGSVDKATEKSFHFEKSLTNDLDSKIIIKVSEIKDIEHITPPIK